MDEKLCPTGVVDELKEIEEEKRHWHVALQ
jgi:hypothetical protein